MTFGAKLRVFNSVSHTVLCYGAQVWESGWYEDVEKLFRYFVKRLFRLPNYARTSFIHIETGIGPTQLYTMKLHHEYIIKVLNMPDSRLPKVLALEIIERNMFWFREINDYILNLVWNPQ